MPECKFCIDYIGAKFCAQCGEKIDNNDVTVVKEAIKKLFTELPVIRQYRKETNTPDQTKTYEYSIDTKPYIEAFDKALKYCFRPFIIDIIMAEHYITQSNTYHYNKIGEFIISEVNVYTVEEFLQLCNIEITGFQNSWLKYIYKYTDLSLNGLINMDREKTFILNGKEMFPRTHNKLFKEYRSPPHSEPYKISIKDYLSYNIHDNFKFMEEGKLYVFWPCSAHQTKFYKDVEICEKINGSERSQITGYKELVLQENPVIKANEELFQMYHLKYQGRLDKSELIKMIGYNPLECTKYKSCGKCKDDKNHYSDVVSGISPEINNPDIKNKLIYLAYPIDRNIQINNEIKPSVVLNPGITYIDKIELQKFITENKK